MGEKVSQIKNENWNFSYGIILDLNGKVQLEKELTIEWIELGDSAQSVILL